jgi:hypothetical protein
MTVARSFFPEDREEARDSSNKKDFLKTGALFDMAFPPRIEESIFLTYRNRNLKQLQIYFTSSQKETFLRNLSIPHISFRGSRNKGQVLFLALYYAPSFRLPTLPGDSALVPLLSLMLPIDIHICTSNTQ